MNFIMKPSLDVIPEKPIVGQIVWAFYGVFGEVIKIPLVITQVYEDGSWRGDPGWGEA